MLAADNVQVPEPSLVSVPLVVPMILANELPDAVPPRVSPKVAPVIVPVLERTIFPVETMLLEDPSVIKPLYVEAVPEVLHNAPPLLTPVPLRVNASAVARVKPFKSSAAPEVIEVPEPVVPRGVLLPLPAAPSLIVPALMVVNPV